MRYCPQCGAQARDSDTFCNKCGAELSGATTIRAPNTRPPAQGISIGPTILIATMLVLASFAGIYLMTTNHDNDANYHLSYSWEYDGQSYEYKMDVSKSDYSKMLSSDINKKGTVSSDMYTRYIAPNMTEVIFGVKDYIVVDKYIDKIAEDLHKMYDKTYGEPVSESAPDFASFVTAFVQTTIVYQDDSVKGQSEYWKYPLETLYDGKGDCEDTSILAAAILNSEKSGSYDAGIFLIPQHAMAGVSAETVAKTYANEHFGYYPIETVTSGVVKDIGYVRDVYTECYFHLYTGYVTDYYFSS